MENNVFSDCLIWYEFSVLFQEYDLKKFRKERTKKFEDNLFKQAFDWESLLIFHALGIPATFFFASRGFWNLTQTDMIYIDWDLLIPYILPISVIRHSFLYSNWKSLRHPSPQTHCVTPSLATMLQPAPARSNLEMDFILTFTLGSLWFLARLAKPTCEKENSQWS